MDTQTQTETARRWYVSDTPSVGDVLVDGTAYGRGADGQAETSVWTVVRTNHTTGRGTVQHTATGRKLQVVRGRFGWSLADGTARPVRFAQPSRETSDGTALFGDDLDGDVVNEQPFSPTYAAVPLDEPELAECDTCGTAHAADVLFPRQDAWSERLLRVCVRCASDPLGSGLEPAPEDAPDTTPRPAPEAYGPQALVAYEARTARRRNGDWS